MLNVLAYLAIICLLAFGFYRYMKEMYKTLILTDIESLLSDKKLKGQKVSVIGYPEYKRSYDRSAILGAFPIFDDSQLAERIHCFELYAEDGLNGQKIKMESKSMHPNDTVDRFTGIWDGDTLVEN